MSRAASAATSGAPTPRSAKVLSVLMFGVFQHQKWRDCRWAISIAAIRGALVRESSGDEEAFHDVLAIVFDRPTLSTA